MLALFNTSMMWRKKPSANSFDSHEFMDAAAARASKQLMYFQMTNEAK